MKLTASLGLVLGLAAMILTSAPAARAAEDTLKKIIPQNAEILVTVNTRAIIDSEVGKKILAQHPEFQKFVQTIQSMIGVNLLQEVDRVTAFGPLNDKARSGIVFQGTFDPQKIVTLVQNNPQYKTSDIQGQTIHEWFDTKDNKMKYGMILPEGGAVIWNSQAALEDSVAAAGDPAKSFAGSPEAALVPKGLEKAVAAAMLVNRQTTGPIAKYRVKAAIVVIGHEQNQIKAALAVFPVAPADTAKWVALAQGLVAAGQLQPDLKPVQELASQAKVEPAPDGQAAVLTITLDQDKLMGVIERKLPQPKP